MLELNKIAGLDISQRIEWANKRGDKNCAYTQSGSIFINEFRNVEHATLGSFVHSHEDYEILIPLTPLPCLVHNDEVIFGEVGFCYPFPSQRKHGINYKITDASYIVVVFQSDWFSKIVKQMKEPVGAMKRFFCSNIIKDLIKMFQSVFKQEFELKEQMLNSIGEALLIEMIRQNFVEYKTIIYKTKEYQRGIQYLVNFINDNYAENLSVDMLANMCNMSKFHFIRSFKKFTSVPPLEYLYKIRCSRAKYLFERTNKNMSEVAKTVGFKSLSSFVQIFKRYNGTTPAKYCIQVRNGGKNEN